MPQEYLPERLRGQMWYRPTEFAYEKTVAERIEFWERLKQRMRSGDLSRDSGS